VAEFDGKVAVVSGAGSVGNGVGNGRAAAILLARAGAAVAVIDIVEEAAEETRGLIEAEGGTALAIGADVTDPDAVRDAVATVQGRFGRIDVLVNNVGIIGAPGNAVEVDPDAWDEVMRINVKSMMLTAKYCVPHMIEAGGGAIVNLASGAGLLGGHGTLAYPASKGAVVSLTRAMAYHHGPDGIRVNCIAPGYVYTPRVALRDDTPEKAAATRDRRRMAAPLHTEGTGWDVGSAVVYLAGQQARWVTGVVLPVDAGFSAGKV
jgi:NAD(P)-dependent dehydrogenase (short-subunit alcohol dehydrogenase family)